ncbi:MAG: helix-turn-helix transcriptional regulator [Lachnospiraceae bacterium]|nr:helix-turn-helix transcriptional regulator [Lachnospiraceae bacterium]
MAVYRIGDVLRMKREALGITREKLCEMSGDICSVQTLYRMECGKVKVKQEVYRKLMECMGELPERRYASIVVSEYQALNLKPKIHQYLRYKEFEQAEETLEQLERVMDRNYVRNKQYLKEIKLYISYCRGEISAEEYWKDLWECLRHTIPSLDNIDLDRWPYNCEEFDILADMVTAYCDMKLPEKELCLLEQLKNNAEKKYMEQDYYITWHSYILGELSRVMSTTNQHEKSIEYCNQGIEELKNQRLLSNMPCLLYDLAWNKEQLMKKGMAEKKEREFCKKLLVQAYYLNVAQKEVYNPERIKKLCERYFPGEITYF